MLRRPPRSTRTDTLLPYTTLSRFSVPIDSPETMASGPVLGEDDLKPPGERKVELRKLGPRRFDGSVPGVNGSTLLCFPGATSPFLLRTGNVRRRSEERRVGKGVVSKFRHRGSPQHKK